MAYLYKRSCTVDHTQCGSTNSTDFPVLVRVTNATLALVASGGHVNNTTTSNGQTVPADLAFFGNAVLSTALSWEVESYDGTTGALVAWVKIPTLSHTVDTVFYLAYGDAAVTTFQGDVNGTWNSAFKGVWHLPNGTTLAAKDSTSNLHDGSISATVAATGVVDGAASFSGGKISFGASADWNFASSFTVSVWFNTSTNQDAVLLGINNGVGTFAWQFDLISSPGAAFSVNGIGSGFSFTGFNDGQWHQAVGQFNAGTAQVLLYVDSSLLATSGSGTFTGSSSIALTAGANAAGTSAYTGLLDELQVAAALRSVDWVIASYKNQKPASTFLTLGAEDVTAYTLTAGSGAYTVTGTRTRLIWSGAATGVFPQAMAIAIMGL